MKPPTETEKRQLRRLPSLLIPFQKPPDFSPTPEEQAEQARLDAELREIEKELAEIERRFPAMVAKENARLEREEKEIRRRVFGRGTTR